MGISFYVKIYKKIPTKINDLVLHSLLIYDSLYFLNIIDIAIYIINNQKSTLFKFN